MGNTLKTNSTFNKLVEEHKLKSTKKINLKSKISSSNKIKGEVGEDKRDSIQNFEDDLMKVVDKDRDK